MIDGPNFHYAQQRASVFVDYAKLKTFFDRNGNVRMIYFDSGFSIPFSKDIDAISGDDAKKILRIVKARENRHYNLKRLGVEIIIPPDGKNEKDEENSDIDVDIGIGQMIINLALDPEYKKIVLVSGDGRHFADFLALAKKIAKKRGKEFSLEVVSGKKELSNRFKSIADTIHIIEEMEGVTEVKNEKKEKE